MDVISTRNSFRGLPISAGVAAGRVCLFNERRHENLPVYHVEGENRVRERNRLEKAVTQVMGQLEALSDEIAIRVGRTEAGIFLAQKAILGDSVVTGQMLEILESREYNAEVAVSEVLNDYESRIQAVDNAYIKERATDIGEIRRRLLDVLGNMNPSLQCAGLEHCQRGRNRIVVAEELTPSLTVDLDLEHTIAFVTERGGVTSHAAILARALGIPAVSGIEGIHSLIPCGTSILVDGTTGEVVIRPSAEELARYPGLHEKPQTVQVSIPPVAGLQVQANISLASEAADAVKARAEGIGLYRTEFEFIAAGRVLSENEQYDRYMSVAAAMKDKPVTFRLLDIGGDKSASFFDLPTEPNPYLGLRGSRFLLARPELIESQARALARVARHRPVNVLYPMIVDREQFREVKEVFCRSIADLPEADIRHGVMFEVPSACLEAREILEVADFGSIGTNDLVQYLFAADRNNELVAHDCDPDKPVFWALISRIVKVAKDLDRPLSVCGEAAGDPDLLAKFIETGVETVSVSSRLISEVRLAAS